MEEVRFYPPPSAPYFFKNSKRFPGKSLEDLLFTQSTSFFSIAHQPHHEGDHMHMHIKFLLTAGDDLETKIICPFCKNENIKFFLLLNNNFIHKNLTCCSNDKCRKELKLGHGNDMLVALKVRNLGMRLLKNKTLRKKAEMLFRQALGLKPKSSPQTVFGAVSKNYLRYFDVSSEKACKEPEALKKETKEVQKKPEASQKESGATLKAHPVQAPMPRRKKKKSCSEKQLILSF